MSNARDKANIPVLNFSSKGIDDNADTNVITIDSSENVGINVTNPGSFYSGSNTLVVKDGISIFDTTDSRLEFVDGTSGSEAYVGNIVYNHASNFMRFGVDVSERMRLTTTGLGIGTTSPTSPLMVQSNETYPIHVKGANAKAILVETTGGETELAILQLKNSAYTWNVENGRSANTLTFYANSGGERMRIDSSGNVGIKNTVMSSFSNLPATDLVVGAGTTDSGITIYSGTTHGSNIAFADGASGDARNQGIIQYHHNGDYMRFFTSASEKMRIDSSGNVLVGKTTTTVNDVGVTLFANGDAGFTRSADACLYLNRKSNDGTLISFNQDNNQEGTISVSGGTVSYNGFTGTHWSRFTDNLTPNILKGTVLESLDEMCDWYNLEFDIITQDEDGNDITTPQMIPHVLLDTQSEGDIITYNHEGTDYQATIVKETDIKHMKSKVSDTVDAKNVYGVFSAYDLDGEGYNDFYVASVGSFVVRIKQGETVAKGDLLQSNGDGTAKVQTDDAVRSSSFAKVLSTTIIKTYEDGSFIVPCSLRC